ncbi:hypothetical protein QWI30_30890 [Citrobacter freundii]|nr:hypothetical protein [Citrobacter freundii]
MSSTADYQSMLQKTGFNADKAAVHSNKFMTSMRGLRRCSALCGRRSAQISRVAWLVRWTACGGVVLDNFPKIEDTLTRVIKGVIWLTNAFTRMAWRLIQGAGSWLDWWKRLDDG